MNPQISDAATSSVMAIHHEFSEQAVDAALVLTSDGVIGYANEGVCRLLQVPPGLSCLPGQNVLSYVHERYLELAKIAVAQASHGISSELEIVFKTTSGDVVPLQSKFFWNEATKSVWLVGQDQRRFREIESKLKQLATQDGLTGLPNRASLARRLAKDISIAKSGGHLFAAVGIDLDGFKRVNDALGHHAGDQLLTEIAARIKACLRPNDTVSRSGGDEFLVVLRGISDSAQAAATSARVLAAIRKPLEVDGHAAHVSASLGVAMYPEHGTTVTEILQHADLAMYQAKKLGKSRVAVYDPVLKSASRQLALEAAMHTALSDGEFSVVYQPIVTPAGLLRGCEALLRWRKSDGTWISPAEFIPVAERSGFINELGDYVLRTATMQLSLFQAAGFKDLFMSVNVSPRQLRDASFEHTLHRAIELSGVDPADLILEITESMLMGDRDQGLVLLKNIAASGVRFSLDDFGTGYSCLSYLKKFPISALKIDRSFLAGVESDEVSRSIVQAIVDLARALKIYTVVEGIETPEQAVVLKDMRADLFQGFLYGRPMSPQEVLERFAQQE